MFTGTQKFNDEITDNHTANRILVWKSVLASTVKRPAWIGTNVITLRKFATTMI
ncbi:MAG: hypothetical protein KTR27_08195 [Leptolyngbyaceae cyanobacterium MAG.088]|nr:hypothetical protein [Leptolyngbyaceae cyanobacterium MAG.088]